MKTHSYFTETKYTFCTSLKLKNSIVKYKIINDKLIVLQVKFYITPAEQKLTEEIGEETVRIREIVFVS